MCVVPRSVTRGSSAHSLAWARNVMALTSFERSASQIHGVGCSEKWRCTCPSSRSRLALAVPATCRCASAAGAAHKLIGISVVPSADSGSATTMRFRQSGQTRHTPSARSCTGPVTGLTSSGVLPGRCSRVGSPHEGSASCPLNRHPSPFRFVRLPANVASSSASRRQERRGMESALGFRVICASRSRLSTSSAPR